MSSEAMSSKNHQKGQQAKFEAGWNRFWGKKTWPIPIHLGVAPVLCESPAAQVAIADEEGRELGMSQAAGQMGHLAASTGPAFQGGGNGSAKTLPWT